jgi:hypothetical protein
MSQRSDAEMREASRVVHYELEMLRNLLFLRNNGLIPDQARMNACVESFAIHCRNLIHFLYAHKPWPDDIIAEHFYPEWHNIRPDRPQVLKEAIDRADKQVAHLKYGRANLQIPDKLWPWDAIYEAVTNVLNVFLASAPKHLLADEWKAPL